MVRQPSRNFNQCAHIQTLYQSERNVKIDRHERTMRSKHLNVGDGKGLYVDLKIETGEVEHGEWSDTCCMRSPWQQHKRNVWLHHRKIISARKENTRLVCSASWWTDIWTWRSSPKFASRHGDYGEDDDYDNDTDYSGKDDDVRSTNFRQKTSDNGMLTRPRTARMPKLGAGPSGGQRDVSNGQLGRRVRNV